MTTDAKSTAIGVFLALVAFRLSEMALHSLGGSIELPVLLVLLAIVAIAVFATGKGGGGDGERRPVPGR